MKYKTMNQWLVPAMLVASLTTTSLFAAGGSEWGNGEGGYAPKDGSIDVKDLLPLDAPVTITTTECRSAKSGFNLNDDGRWEISYPSILGSWGDSKSFRSESLDKVLAVAVKKAGLKFVCKRKVKTAINYAELYDTEGREFERGSLNFSHDPLIHYFTIEHAGVIYEAHPGHSAQFDQALGFEPGQTNITIDLKTLSKQQIKDLSVLIESATQDEQLFAGRQSKRRVAFSMKNISDRVTINYPARPTTPLQLSLEPMVLEFPSTSGNQEIQIPLHLSTSDEILLGQLNHILASLPMMELTTAPRSLAMYYTQAPIYQQWLAQVDQAIQQIPAPSSLASQFAIQSLARVHKGYRESEIVTPMIPGVFKNDTEWHARYSSTDYNEMNVGKEKIRDRLLRLKFKFPAKIELNDPRGCGYILDIVQTLHDLHNAYLAPTDWPASAYGSTYLEEIHKLMEWLDQLNYRPEAKGDFLDRILPDWQIVCAMQKDQITEILADFR